MKSLLTEYLRLLAEADVRAPDASGWSVHQHVEHVAVSAGYFLTLLARLSKGEGTADGRPRLIGRIVLRTGIIPRGKGEAPDFVVPTGRRNVRRKLERARDKFAGLGTLPRGGHRLPHPFLGALSARQWARFAEVHTRHHLKIIRDILRVSAR